MAWMCLTRVRSTHNTCVRNVKSWATTAAACNNHLHPEGKNFGVISHVVCLLRCRSSLLVHSVLQHGSSNFLVSFQIPSFNKTRIIHLTPISNFLKPYIRNCITQSVYLTAAN
ncbi:hypothetical protein ILYODFUR_010338 [Ilyodon furcidens]|uniref:Uncharacterized protein n=1 Tax=Ilyodon furcidens TaxID=33524 RepID=A0ABV0UR11_9TELE